MKAKSFTASAILGELRSNKRLVVLLALVTILTALASLVPPQLLRIIIDDHLAVGRAQGLVKLSLIYLAVLVAAGLLDFAKGGAITVFGQKIIRALRLGLAEKLAKIKISYFTGHTPGTISSLFINDIENVNALFTEGLVNMLIDCFKLLGIVISIWLFSWELGFFCLLLIPLIGLITRMFQKRMLKAQTANLEQVSRVNNHIDESLKNLHMIKSYSKEDYMEQAYAQYLEDNFKTIEKVNFYDSCYTPVIQIIRAVVIALIVLLSSSQLNMLGISLGMVAASIELISSLFAPIDNLGTELQNIQKGLSGMKRVNAFCAEEEDDEKDPGATAQSIRSGQALELRLENLTFAYPEAEPTLSGISLTVKNGEHVVFIGRTGVGKSTLLKLVTGLLKPDRGCVQLNGVDAYTVPNGEKRRLFGYVEQRFRFVEGTVAEQISLGDPDISHEGILRAMEAVQLHELVMALPMQYGTPARTVAFSQGQQQLLAIARAIAANPPILLLDEITANLDAGTEAEVMAVLQKVSERRTILSISHRHSAMMQADRAVLLENGQIRATGTPEALLQEIDWLKQLELEQNAR